MNDTFDPRLESLAEAVAFAHENAPVATPPATGTPPSTIALDHRELATIERAAALASAALVAAHTSPLPVALRHRLQAAGLEFCAGTRTTARQASPAFAAPRPTLPFGRWLLLAALLLLGLGLWSSLGLPGSGRSELLRRDPAAVQLSWTPGSSPLRGAVQGEVLWSQREQRGLLTFRGLPPCPDGHRFQLWIVDRQRDGAPVDGGLFDVQAADGETTVPVLAKLPIGEPGAFVVTVEKSAGAVVSKQEHVVAIASR